MSSDSISGLAPVSKDVYDLVVDVKKNEGCHKDRKKYTLPINSKSSLLASPRAAGAATVTRTSSAFTP